MRLRRYTDWIAATVNRRRVASAAPPCATPRPDPEAVARVGDVLQTCYPDVQDPIDDALTVLMLHLAVVPSEPSGPGKT